MYYDIKIYIYVLIKLQLNFFYKKKALNEIYKNKKISIHKNKTIVYFFYKKNYINYNKFNIM